MTRFLEPFMWTLALGLLFFMDGSTKTFSFCFFQLVGFEKCFGCGIGHAIHYALHLDIGRSFNEHVLGLPATIAILYRIITSFNTKNQNNEFATNAYDAARDPA